MEDTAVDDVIMVDDVIIDGGTGGRVDVRMPLEVKDDKASPLICKSPASKVLAIGLRLPLPPQHLKRPHPLQFEVPA